MLGALTSIGVAITILRSPKSRKSPEIVLYLKGIRSPYLNIDNSESHTDSTVSDLTAIYHL